MHDLEITWSGGQIRFSPDDSPVLIGRSSSASVVVPQGTVSRRHLIMTWNGRSWEAEDVSTHGTFDPIGVRLAASWTVGTNLVVRLGSPRGAEISLRLITRALDIPAAADPFLDSESPPTVVDFGPPPPPDADGHDPLHIRDRALQPDITPDPASAEPVVAKDGSSRFEPPPPGSPYEASPQVAPRPVSAFNDPSSFRPEPVEFDPPEAATAAGDSEGRQQLLVDSPDPADGEGADPPWGPSAEEGNGSLSDPVEVDFTADDPVIHLDGSTDQDGAMIVSPVAEQVSDVADDFGWNDADSHELGGAGLLGRSQAEERPGPAATFVENDTLRLQIDGEDYVFLPGHEVTVGRDPRCTVIVDERHSLVSRRHLRFVHAEGAWWLEDASSKGTYVDGRRLNRPYRAEGAFIASLGDGAAGTQLRVVTSGQHRQPTDRAGLAIAAVAAAALVLAALVAWFVFGGGDNEAAVLSTAKKSTVMLLSDSGHGSGFFVSGSLIVTNQHVAAMADRLVVAVSPEEDEPAEIQYVASLLENHPFLDIAVVKITNRAEFNDQGTVTIGEPIDSADVPLLRLGDSSAVTIGDPVTSTGFPGRFSVSSSDDSGQLRLAAVSITQGQAANFTSWPGCSTPDLSSFIPPDAPPTVTCSASGNIDKGVLLASFPSGEGASGSAVIHEDEVVAVLFAGDSQDATASRSIATNAFSDWLSGILAEND
ncbi:MAG: FHA domain-containing protein [Acidimicrobiia bacterium]|nr:FHA domain-containing protein [Acidimicrobiia bacterium]